MKKALFVVVLVMLCQKIVYGQTENPENLVKTKYPVINFHHHLGFGGKFSAEDVFKYELEAMDASGIVATSNLNAGYGDTFEEWIKVKQKYPDKIILFVNIDYGVERTPGSREMIGKRLNEPDYADIIAKYLEYQKEKGAQAVKVSKSLGLYLKDVFGNYIHVDDKRFYPYWKKAGELGMPVLIHSADPIESFEKMHYNSLRYNMINPKWDFSESFGVEGYNRLLSELLNVVRDHPNTNFVSAHFSNLSTELDRLAEMLDTYPNFYVDPSARFKNGLRYNTPAIYDFFIKYQDRILFGTDSNCYAREKSTEESLSETSAILADFFRRHWLLLETNRVDLYEPNNRDRYRDWLRLTGLNLPEEVLEKVYYKNARRLLPDM
jgi:predicted TIM-barrel fold metal-dependent hydrolase